MGTSPYLSSADGRFPREALAVLPHPAVGLPLNDLPFATPDLGLAISAGTAGGLGFAQFLDGAGYHTMRDAPDAVESGSLQDHGDNALALTRHSGA